MGKNGGGGGNKETGTRFPAMRFSRERLLKILTLRQFPLDAFAEWHYRRCSYECASCTLSPGEFRASDVSSRQVAIARAHSRASF